MRLRCTWVLIPAESDPPLRNPTAGRAQLKVNNYTTNISSYSIILSLCNLATFGLEARLELMQPRARVKAREEEECFFRYPAKK